MDLTIRRAWIRMSLPTWCERYGMLKRLLRRTAPEYLVFVRTRPCIVCRSGASDAHHLVSRGAGGSDYQAIPLCRKHHSEIHQVGRGKFRDRYELDYGYVRATMLEEFICNDEGGLDERARQ